MKEQLLSLPQLAAQVVTVFNDDNVDVSDDEKLIEYFMSKVQEQLPAIREKLREGIEQKQESLRVTMFFEIDKVRDSK